MQQQFLLQQTFAYTVRRTKRKTLGIYVFVDGAVEVRIPKSTSKREMLAFVESETSWVLAQLELQAERPVLGSVRFDQGAKHYFLGHRYALLLQAGRTCIACLDVTGRSVVNNDHNDDGILKVSVADPEDEVLVKRALKGWYREEARRYFERRLARMLAQLNRQVLLSGRDRLAKPELKIRAMKTRWGSCSSNGNINLNLWMIRLPIELIDYVIAHELCHLLEFNHSPQFYRLLGKLQPQWQQHKIAIGHHPASGPGF